MKAVTYHNYGAPEVLAVEEVEKPTPGQGELLIRIHAATVSAADCAFRRGDPLARLFMGLTGPKRPVLGTAFAGQIEAVGPGVVRFAVGDQVFAAADDDFGAHAEYLCMPEDGAVALKPINVDFAEAAAASAGAMTALPFLRDEAELQPGQRVLINGAMGSVGSAAIQLAKHYGAIVTGVGSTRNLDLMRSLGADAVIDRSEGDFTHTGGTYEVIFDAVGKSSFSRCKHMLAPGGVYLSTVPSLALMIQVLWTSRFGDRRAKVAFAGLRTPAEKTKDLVFLRALIEAGALKGFIDARYPMERAAEAHQLVDTGHKRGQVVMELSASPS